jgi:hypothetical protein
LGMLAIEEIARQYGDERDNTYTAENPFGIRLGGRLFSIGVNNRRSVSLQTVSTAPSHDTATYLFSKNSSRSCW